MGQLPRPTMLAPDQTCLLDPAAAHLLLLISPVTAMARTAHHGGAAIRSSRAFPRRRSSEAIGNVAAGGIAWLLAAGAYTQTDEIQVYDATINVPSQFILELHNNYTPIGRKQPDFEGGIVYSHAPGFTIWSYGTTARRFTVPAASTATRCAGAPHAAPPLPRREEGRTDRGHIRRARPDVR